MITFLKYSGSSRFTIEPNLGPIIVGSLRLVAAGKKYCMQIRFSFSETIY